MLEALHSEFPVQPRQSMTCLGTVRVVRGGRDGAQREATRGAQISGSMLVMYCKPVYSFAHHG